MNGQRAELARRPDPRCRSCQKLQAELRDREPRLAVQLDADRRRRCTTSSSANAPVPTPEAPGRRRAAPNGAGSRLTTSLIFCERRQLQRDDALPAAARSRARAANFWPSVSAHFMKSTMILRLRLVLRVLVEEQPGERRDRVGALARRVGDRDAEVRRHLRRRGRRGRRDRLERRPARTRRPRSGPSRRRSCSAARRSARRSRSSPASA